MALSPVADGSIRNSRLRSGLRQIRTSAKASTRMAMEAPVTSATGEALTTTAQCRRWAIRIVGLSEQNQLRQDPPPEKNR